MRGRLTVKQGVLFSRRRMAQLVHIPLVPRLRWVPRIARKGGHCDVAGPSAWVYMVWCCVSRLVVRCAGA